MHFVPVNKNKDGIISIGKIVSCHGIRGVMKVRNYLSNLSLFFKDSVVTVRDLDNIEVKLISSDLNFGLIRMDDISSKKDAERFIGKEITSSRTLLGTPEVGSYYVIDMIGLDVLIRKDLSHEPYGKIVDVPNYGGGDLIEVLRHDNPKTELYPFIKSVFPVINLDSRFVILSKMEMINAEIEGS